MRTKSLVLLYLCTRDVDFLFEHIQRKYPILHALSLQVRNSHTALSTVPKAGAITILTSNTFRGLADEIGADGKPEEEMTGAKIATLIKKKNPQAKVYMYAQHTAKDAIFDGVIQRDVINDIVPKELEDILSSLLPEIKMPYGKIRDLRNAIRADKQHLASAPLSKRAKQKLKDQITAQHRELKLVRSIVAVKQQLGIK